VIALRSCHGRPASQISRRSVLNCLVLVTCACWPIFALAVEPANSNWPQWRGPLATGVAPTGNPPTEWSETKNIRWKTPLPGKGHSTPVIWGNRIFVTTAIPAGPAVKAHFSGAPGAHDNSAITHHHEYVVMALDRRTGKILWKQTVSKQLPHEGGHNTASLASHSPLTDGKRVYASFGSQGVHVLALDGKPLWKSDLGKMHTKHGHGEGSSPVLFENTLVINWDHEGKSFVVALDASTGKERWKQARNEVTSWATPIVVQHQGQPQVIISGTGRVRSYDLATGKVNWQCGGLSANIVASPVAADGMVFVGSSYEKRALFAVKLEGAAGDITGTKQVAWSRTRGTPYVPSPLLYGKALYFLAHYQSILSRVNATTGKDEPGAYRLGPLRNIYASPVGAADRIYITDLDGQTLVMTHSEIPRVLALNKLDDSFSASAAIAGDEFYLRGAKSLYCLASEE
ncbi:MAG: PQQ-binding-like beta-propeller repeat protein, partial [Pirellulaceae bacterium]